MSKPHVRRNQIPKDARAARNLRRYINRCIKGMRPFDTRGPIHVWFSEGITDSIGISNLWDDDREELARKITKRWHFSDKGRFYWKARTSCISITPMYGPLLTHPIVLNISLRAFSEINTSSRDPRIQKHFDAQKRTSADSW